MFVGGSHDNEGFTLSGIAQTRQDCVFVAEDAGLKDLQTMLANVLPVAGKGWAPGCKLQRDQRKGIAQVALVGDDRRQKCCQRKQGQGKDKGAVLHREAQRSLRIGEPLGVIMADLDHFKYINDNYGHPTGDAVLREVARRILASVRNYDYVGRYGGEEFLMVLAECSASDVAVTAERVRVCVSRKPVDTDAGLFP